MFEQWNILVSMRERTFSKKKYRANEETYETRIQTVQVYISKRVDLFLMFEGNILHAVLEKVAKILSYIKKFKDKL